MKSAKSDLGHKKHQETFGRVQIQDRPRCKNRGYFRGHAATGGNSEEALINANVFIFDEPTAVPTPQETEALIGINHSLVKEGKLVIFIKHKIKEDKAAADQCTMIRHGKHVAI